jgi:hypothetical protein
VTHDADDIFAITLLPLAVVTIACEGYNLSLYAMYAVHYVAATVAEENDISDLEILASS